MCRVRGGRLIAPDQEQPGCREGRGSDGAAEWSFFMPGRGSNSLQQSRPRDQVQERWIRVLEKEFTRELAHNLLTTVVSIGETERRFSLTSLFLMHPQLGSTAKL